MKKLFTICVALVSAITMSAVQVTFNFSTADGLSAMSITPATVEDGASQGKGVDFATATVDGVIVTGDKGTNSLSPRVWTSTNKTTELRVYGGNTLVIKGAQESDKITHIEFTGGDVKFAEVTNGQWTNNEGVNSVTFTTTATRKVSTITVTMNEAAVEYEPDTLTVSQAINLIKNNATLAAKAHYVKGIVAGDPFTLGSNGPAFFMTDYVNHSDSLEAFKIDKDASTKYKDAEEMSKDIAMGDTILIFADGLSKYNDIFETTGGYFVKTLGKSSAIALNWVAGSAYLQADGWALEIAEKQNDTKNLVEFSIKSSKKDGIAGSYPFASGAQLTKNGAKSAITSGSLVLTFKEIGTNGYNVYAAQVTFAIGEAIYRIKNDVEFYASDAEGNEIVLTGDRPFKPTEGQEITCAQAKEYAMSLAAGTTGDISVVVKGYVTKIVDATTFWMDDAKGSKETFEAYKVKNFTPVGKEIALGSQVKLTGKVTNYNGKTAEIKDGSVEIIDGVDIQVTEATVAEALAACKALAQNASSTDTYAITGFITGIAREFSDQYGNISFWMSDQAGDEAAEFQAYNVKCDATLAAKLVAGAKVKVTDKLKHFHQDAKPATDTEEAKPERTVYETVGGGSVELIQGAAVEVIRTDAPAVKFIENGQIIIIRNGVRYNVQGQLAK